ncbi:MULTISPECIES: DsbA family protein [unclassified Streptosporangium]|uniref:DsbA family protein n=1 Tax=unclassified Streptosporangium TaxID=2632669 RepID=UPI002DD9A715|nr:MULTISPECIES: DsbA family protein [unclassified Streptosporangium]
MSKVGVVLPTCQERSRSWAARRTPTPGSGPGQLEFLDFECEACRAAFPVVEDLHEQYAGKVTFVVRYFPLPGHFNAERAARAVVDAALAS